MRSRSLSSNLGPGDVIVGLFGAELFIDSDKARGTPESAGPDLALFEEPYTENCESFISLVFIFI